MILNKVLGLLAIAVSVIHGADYYNPDIQADIEAAIVSSVIYAPVPTPRMLIAAEPPEYTASNDAKTVCHNYRTDFKSNLRGWQVENTMQDTYDINEVAELPYNLHGGRGPTLNATTYIRYGKISATIKSAGTGGSVTAFILMADGGDEIDFEFLGGDTSHVQSNYFWGKTVEYTVNGGIHDVPNGAVDQTFHKYTIDWTPDKIDWLVDDKVVRTRLKADTCDKQGQCKFPSQPARIQFGLWDGSIESGTAEWSRGPIDWALPQTISAHIKDVTVDCNPAYNQIVN
ncbi:concanavalin A-like lectin/glucanase domain-containing protein [Mucor mucedo]|uniref:concanavalin A-like lectin/glucanase domain-containing protein n=1 Tax=Mucor mucedo TaxID=29922 RepID=UPI00221E8A7D|nr:concanavalin A-like lectin/glucanase domain-containing protein [Mucor mucedo]KAI7890187.1 concanavalin A-like lectin/glucanase domain-containing protein [Mucor mucedo]